MSYKLFIDGQFVDATGGKTFDTFDPGTGARITEVAQAGTDDAKAAIDAARRAFESGVWSGLTPEERLAKICDFADQMFQQAMRMAVSEAQDTGQVVSLTGLWALAAIGHMRNLSISAVKKFAWQEEIPISGSIMFSGRDYIRREPLGVVSAIVPWNFPLYIAMWKIAPALITGNTMVLKPASISPLSALIMAECAKEAGIPDGVFNVLPGPGGELGKVLCTHKDVDKIAFTGSTEVGREIMKLGADTAKKVTLELGGKSAAIVLDDADMDLAVEGACFGSFFHQGQVCSATTRILVHAGIYDEFVSRMKKRADAYRIGYQLEPTSHLGPLASSEQLAIVDRYVQIGKEEGAKLITGGKRAEIEGYEDGYYYQPTIFADVKNSMRIAQEEIFGPVSSVIKYDSDEEAIAIANDSIYGLGGAVYSSNNARAQHIAHNVRTGTMCINSYGVFGDYCPFGGYKQSGMGRDMGMEALDGYTQVKRVHISGFADAKTNNLFNIISDRKRTDGVSYNCSTDVHAGHGSLAMINKIVADLGCSRALIITDAGIVKAGLAELAKNALSDFCVGVYDKILPDPDLESIDKAVDYAREVKADCIVSVGGGSVIDSSKAVCVTLKNGGKVHYHLNLNILDEPQTPHIVIPTSGSGSEVTSAAVVTCHAAGRKLFMASPHIFPNAAILDPRFAMTLPKHMTVATAMDSMTHAVEAMMDNWANRISDAQALHAVRLIYENLPLAVADGTNEQARHNLQIASALAGWAFAIAQVGLAHCMAHTLGTLFHVPHGEACGLVLPKVMRFNVDHATKALVQVARALDVNTAGMEERDAALAAADAMEALMEKVGHPLRLRDVGIKEEDLYPAAFHAVCDLNTVFNPRQCGDPNEIVLLYQEAF